MLLGCLVEAASRRSLCAVGHVVLPAAMKEEGGGRGVTH